MKQKFLVILVMLAVGLTACSLDDEDSNEFRPKTETWDVIIEPEYVFGYSFWGAETNKAMQMEAINDKGELVGRFFPGEIEGFTFEEGYRYLLKIDATTTDPRIMDGPAYHFKLNKIVDKSYVGIRTEGRREMTMDVQKVLAVTSDPLSSVGYYFLCGHDVDGGGRLDMGIHEVIGASDEMFHHRDEANNFHRYVCRMRLSITPSEQSVFGNHNYRIRLEELISQREIPEDSIVVVETMEELRERAKEWY